MSANAADWISAGAAVFGAVGTVGALFVAMRLLRSEQRARRAAEEHDARATAEFVCAWWRGVERLEPTPADAERGVVLGFAVSATVRNGSDEPIYDVIVDMPQGPTSDTEPGDIDLLAPHTETNVLIVHRRHPGGDDPAPMFGIPSVAFTDARGRRWCRDHDGALAVDFSPVDPHWKRVQASSRRQDQWFETWDENPFARTKGSLRSHRDADS